MVEQWHVKKDPKGKGKEVVKKRIVLKKWNWWACNSYDASTGDQLIGGYATDQNGATIVWLGDRAHQGSSSEAYLMGIEDDIQFLIEEMNAREEEINICVYVKEIADWLHETKETSWSQSVGVDVMVMEIYCHWIDCVGVLLILDGNAEGNEMDLQDVHCPPRLGRE
ncbi:hypothetical protein PIB30_102135 [Stylosanthes scabra]|uniref:Uncharacterized protein n=1 Tax=Stylosanthes scabra TaxID=79078 RepID=A0ABU6ZX53_9FABA|nr:hypothetical protein [Stylosanthes scabra]